MGERKGRRSERGLRGKGQGGEGVRVEKGRKDEPCIKDSTRDLMRREIILVKISRGDRGKV